MLMPLSAILISWKIDQCMSHEFTFSYVVYKVIAKAGSYSLLYVNVNNRSYLYLYIKSILYQIDRYAHYVLPCALFYVIFAGL